jgi:hypothetical protein
MGSIGSVIPKGVVRRVAMLNAEASRAYACLGETSTWAISASELAELDKAYAALAPTDRWPALHGFLAAGWDCLIRQGRMAGESAISFGPKDRMPR